MGARFLVVAALGLARWCIDDERLSGSKDMVLPLATGPAPLLEFKFRTGPYAVYKGVRRGE